MFISQQVSTVLPFPHKPEVWRDKLIWHQGDTYWFPTRHTLNTILHGLTNLPLPLSYYPPAAFNFMPCLSLASFVSLIYVFFKADCLPLSLSVSLSLSSFHLCSLTPFCFHLSMHPCFPLSSSNSIHCLSLLLLSSSLQPSLSLLTQALLCFDIWPNYLANWGSCSCHRVWWWGTTVYPDGFTIDLKVKSQCIVCNPLFPSHTLAT